MSTDPSNEVYYAHSGNAVGSPFEPYSHHVEPVVTKCVEFASEFGSGEEARVAALLHDAGKLSETFTRRLRREASGFDHWTIGAVLAASSFGSLAGGCAILGHHVGLGKIPYDLASYREVFARTPHPGSHGNADGLSLTEPDHKIILDRVRQHSHEPKRLEAEQALLCLDESFNVAKMLDVRMLFSCLVDADYLATEAHFKGRTDGTKEWRKAGPSLDPAAALHRLTDYVEELERSPGGSAEVMGLRHDLWRTCLERGGELPVGAYTLSAPTGAGKTLAMLGFALAHAACHHLRRVVMVIPYLNIIEQTVEVYRRVFADFDKAFIVEHSSQAGRIRRERAHESSDGEDEQDIAAQQARLLAENWDAPIIITTSVQALESLFANMPVPCRKLHRLARSVILFDEVQTLPPSLAVPTLAALSRLSERYSATVVFSTATQPAFDHLDGAVKEYAAQGWKPAEVVPQRLGLFKRVERVVVDWSRLGEQTAWEQLANEIAAANQGLCIVNLKAHARHLAALVEARLDERERGGLFHLSTSMCPAHRQKVLAEVNRRLAASEPCRLVATQCVEAGVDLDFPHVWRSLAPLEAIAQAAGRCNRRGLLKRGHVVVFKPEPMIPGGPLFPGSRGAGKTGGYEKGACMVETLLAERGPAGMDIQNPELFRQYYTRLYDVAGHAKVDRELEQAIVALNCADVARHYRLIDADTINIVVPYEGESELYWRLRREMEAEGGRLTRAWIDDAKPLTIGEYRACGEKWRQRESALHPVIVAWKRKLPILSDEWFILIDEASYDPRVGYSPREVIYLHIV